VVTSVDEARKVIDDIGFPCILRPSFTLGGSAAASPTTLSEFDRRWCSSRPRHVAGPPGAVEESVLGWKEYELEVVRDTKDNVIIICSIENFDPMGVHTGDSITVAPAHDAHRRSTSACATRRSRSCARSASTTGGSTCSSPSTRATGRMIVIEMNPRVSRSSALASKATGFPIAKIAAKLAVGYTLDELKNDITRTTPACFEPTIDYVVVKSRASRSRSSRPPTPRSTTQMKSVGEAMAIGRTFREALGKAIRSLETGRAGFDAPLGALADDLPGLERAMAVPGPERCSSWPAGCSSGCRSSGSTS
jgi:carbamoyl-phosphate synthase large subunit